MKAAPKLTALAKHLPASTFRLGGGPRATGERLDLVLPPGWPQSGEAVAWRWSRGSGPAQSGLAADLAQLPAGATRAWIQVWTPAADTLLTQATLPTRSHRKIVQALPYALEDQLLGEPESLHFAYRREADGKLSVAVTARERLRTWLESLNRSGIRPAALCPTTLLAPWALDCWSLAFRDGEILVRTGAVAGFVCPAATDAPPAILGAAVNEAAKAKRAPEALVVFQPPPGFAAERWAETLGVPLRVERVSVWDKQVESQPAINLLQGEFMPGGEHGAFLRPFLPAAVMLAVWFVGNVVIDTADWWRLHRLHQAYTAEMTTILRKTFPDTTVVLDPAAQMRRNLEALQGRQGGDDGMLPLLAQLAPALRAEAGVRLRSVRYADKALTADVTAPTSSALDALKQKLARAGMRAEILGTTPRANEVDGHLRIIRSASAPAHE